MGLTKFKYARLSHVITTLAYVRSVTDVTLHVVIWWVAVNRLVLSQHSQSVSQVHSLPCVPSTSVVQHQEHLLKTAYRLRQRVALSYITRNSYVTLTVKWLSFLVQQNLLLLTIKAVRKSATKYLTVLFLAWMTVQLLQLATLLLTGIRIVTQSSLNVQLRLASQTLMTLIPKCSKTSLLV